MGDRKIHPKFEKRKTGEDSHGKIVIDKTLFGEVHLHCYYTINYK